MTTPEAHLASLAETLLDGGIIRERLLEAIADVERLGLLSPEPRAALSKDERRTIDSLALNFGNFSGIIQDQIMRLVLLIEGDEPHGTRRERRLRAESIGLIGPASRVDLIAEVRNRIAHQYPRDPERQRRLLSDIVEQSRRAIDVFDDARDFVERRYDLRTRGGAPSRPAGC